MASKSDREQLQALVKKCHNLRRDISKYSAELKQKDDDSLFSKFEERTDVADDEIEEVVELVEQKDDQLFQKIGDNYVTQLVYDHLERAALLDDMVGNKPSAGPSGDSDSSTVYFNDVVERQGEITTEISRELSLKNELEQQNIAMRAKNRDLQQQLKQLRQRLDKAVERSNDCENRDEGDEGRRKQFQEEINRYVLLQNIFQGLIVSSQVHWAEDDELCDIMLNLGTDVHELIDRDLA